MYIEGYGIERFLYVLTHCFTMNTCVNMYFLDLCLKVNSTLTMR